MFLPKICVQWFDVLISSYLPLQKPPMFSAHSSPSNLHLAITRLLLLRRAILQYITSPILCVRDPGGSWSEWTKGTEVRALKFCRVTITRLHQKKKKKHMLCISTCWRCKVPLILVHKDMNEKSPLVIVIARICILDHETLSSRVHYCNGDHVLIKILLIRKPSMLTIHVNFKIYIYMLIKTIHVNLLLQLVRALDTLQLTHHSRLSRQKLNLRNQDPTVRKGCSLRSLPIFGSKSYTPFSGFNFKHVESYSSQLSIKCIYLQSYSKVEEWWRLLLVNPPISTDVPPKHWHHVTTPSSWVPWCKGTILRSN